MPADFNELLLPYYYELTAYHMFLSILSLLSKGKNEEGKDIQLIQTFQYITFLNQLDTLCVTLADRYVGAIIIIIFWPVRRHFYHA